MEREVGKRRIASVQYNNRISLLIVCCYYRDAVVAPDVVAPLPPPVPDGGGAVEGRSLI